MLNAKLKTKLKCFLSFFVVLFTYLAVDNDRYAL